MHKRAPAFTIMEVMIVSLIIGMFASLSVAQLSQVRIRARNTKAKFDLATMSQAVERFKSAERLSDQVISASQVTNVGAHPNAAAPLNNTYSCLDIRGLLATCNTNAVGMSQVQDTAMRQIFTGQEVTSDTTQNTYSAPAPSSSGSGYLYYYITRDVAVPAAADKRSGFSDYIVVADLGEVGGALDAVSRFYVIRSGAGLVPVTNPNLINGGTGGVPSRADSFIPTFDPNVQH